MSNTGDVGRNAAMNPRMPMQKKIYDHIKANGPRDCYQLEDEVPGSHQTVSGSITTLVKNQHLEIIPERVNINRFGNKVRVYRLGSVPFVGRAPKQKRKK